MNHQNIIKYKKYALLGMIGTILFMIGDLLLDVKPMNNITSGIVESGWSSMSMWRFEASILLGAVAVPLWFLGLLSVGKAIKDKHKKAGEIYLFGAVVGSLGGLFIHTTCNLLPIIYKIVYTNNKDMFLTTNILNDIVSYIMIPFAAYFAILEIFTAIPLIYVILSGKMGISKWNALCNPIVTIFISKIMDQIPFYPVNAITGAMESFGHFLMCIVIFRYYKKILGPVKNLSVMEK